MLLGLRQSFQLSQHGCHALRLIERLVSGEMGSDQTLRKPNIKLLRLYAPPAINCQIPGDPHQPDAHLSYLHQLVLALDHANEDILHDILGFAAAAQNRVRNAKEQSGVCLDERREFDLFPRIAYLRKRQN